MADPTAPLPPGSFDSRVPTTVGATIVCLSIASMAVVLRTYTRGFIINQMGVDDWFAIVSLLVTYGSGIAILCMTQFGLGHHVWMIPDPQTDIPNYLRGFYVSIVMYCAALFSIKMTFLFQYYRVFAVQQLRKWFILAIVIVGGWSLSQVLVGIFICSPIAGFWDSTIPSTCVPNYPQFYINAAGNIATDLAVLLMPFPLLKRLNLPKQQKYLLFAIFAIGFFTVSISVLRFKYLTVREDFSWDNVEAAAWSVAELCSGITCACLPTLRPFLKAHFPGLGTRLTNGYQNYRNDEEESGGASAAVAARKRSASGGESSHVSPVASRTRNASGGGESTEDIIGLENTGRGQHEMEGRGATLGEEDRQADLGLRLTVLSRVGRGEVERPAPLARSGSGIQVQREVYQVKQQRGV